MPDLKITRGFIRQAQANYTAKFKRRPRKRQRRFIPEVRTRRQNYMLRYFRPTEVDLLLGDPSKAEKILGWHRRVSFEDLVKRMVKYDLKIFNKDILVKNAGYEVLRALEE